ncbi:MAG: phosphoglucosamine mutase [Terriglobia bacterium]
MSTKPQLFGTDGVRGIAGEYPLDRDTVVSLGKALGSTLIGAARSTRPEVVLGEDTRESSPWIARSLAAGLRSADLEVAFAGVITTPGIAFLTRHHGFAAGVMISASHNPFEDNGIKVISSAGTKLPESVELEIESAFRHFQTRDGPVPDVPLNPLPELLDEYLSFLETLAPHGHRRFKLVCDAANGSSSAVVPALARRIGAEFRILNAEPNGRNINLGCGSLHPQEMAAETRGCRADLGVAFDGDADRAIFASPRGKILDGDHILFAAAPFLQALHALKGNAVVGTLMTNLGLELALKSHAIALKRTPVGDRFVLEEMLRSGINLGGEPSGHIIFSDVSAAGDGIVTLLEVLGFLSETGMSADDLIGDYKPFPQLILNVRVSSKPPLDSLSEVAGALEHCRSDLGVSGRVVLRYSGTEPLARVMVEAEDAASVRHHAAAIAGTIQKTIGI